MAGQNSPILATDYNVIQSKVSQVMGSGIGNIGYGQTVLSSQVAIKTTATATQWNNLRTDLLKARQHQTGTDLSHLLNEASSTVNITETDRKAYYDMAVDALDSANRLIKPPAGQATRDNLVAVQQRSTPWNSSLSQTIQMTFPSIDAARYFFNTGSQIEFSVSRSLGTSNLKNSTWSTMLSSMGTIEFKHDSTSCTGSGDPAVNLGYYQLTQDDKLIFSKLAPSGAYADNKFFIYARLGNGLASQVIFTINFQDASGGPVDENPDGLLVTTVQAYYATGSNVSVAKPPAQTTSIA